MNDYESLHIVIKRRKGRKKYYSRALQNGIQIKTQNEIYNL